MQQPRVRYADSGALQIAYQVVGGGPTDVVVGFDWGSNVELVWGIPSFERFLRSLASFARLILFDTRGMGLSDPIESPAPPEEWMDDVRAVMDAAGSRRAALVGHGYAGQLAMLFAASHPDRTQALVTINAFARLARADDYPAGMPPKVQQAYLDTIAAHWGSGVALPVLAPTLVADDQVCGRWAAIERSGGSPRRAAAKQRLVLETDVRRVLPTIAVPTLVIQAAGNEYVRPGHGRYLAEHILGARYLELPGPGHWPWVADAEALIEAIEEFLTGARSFLGTERVLATILFTDIVDSTRLAAKLGDRRWNGLLETHDSVGRRAIEAMRGRLVKSTGDGVVATFDGPARAIRAAVEIGAGLRGLGLTIRAGLHTGEIEVRGDDISGLAVHIGARVAERAGPDEVLVSSTVKDLVAGSGIAFEDRGTHDLKGVPGSWHLFSVRGERASAGSGVAALVPESSAPAAT